MQHKDNYQTMEKDLIQIINQIDAILVKEEICLSDASNIFITMLCTSLSFAKITTENVRKILKPYLEKYQEIENNNWD